jgi:hypothetical protein
LAPEKDCNTMADLFHFPIPAANPTAPARTSGDASGKQPPSIEDAALDARGPHLLSRQPSQDAPSLSVVPDNSHADSRPQLRDLDEIRTATLREMEGALDRGELRLKKLDEARDARILAVVRQIGREVQRQAARAAQNQHFARVIDKTARS